MTARRTIVACAWRATARLRALARDTRAVSMIELALILPILITLGLFGVELANLTSVSMQVADLASSVADNASRLGQTDNSAVTPTVKETDVDAVMLGAIEQGAGFDFQANGRIILSSLELDQATNRQYIHWQRCRGALGQDSAYGPEGFGKTGATLDGMGEKDHLITAPPLMAVMYAEVYYRYEPLFGTMFIKPALFRREAAYLIRDDRNLVPGVTGGNGKSLCT